MKNYGTYELTDKKLFSFSISEGFEKIFVKKGSGFEKKEVPSTHCLAVVHSTLTGWIIFAEYTVKKHHKDEFNRRVARKYLMSQILYQLGLEEADRKIFWTKFLGDKQ